MHYPPGEVPRRQTQSHRPTNVSQITFGEDGSSFSSTTKSTYVSPKHTAVTRERAAGVPSNVPKTSNIIFSTDKPVFQSTTMSALRDGASVTREFSSTKAAGMKTNQLGPGKDQITLPTLPNSKELLKSEQQRDFLPPKAQKSIRQPEYSVQTTRGTDDVVRRLCFCFSCIFMFLNNNFLYSDTDPITPDIFGYERYRVDQKRGYQSLATTEKRRLDDPSYTPSKSRGPSSDDQSPFPSATYSYPRDKPVQRQYHHPLGESKPTPATRNFGASGKTRAAAQPQYFLKQSSYNIITGQ